MILQRFSIQVWSKSAWKSRCLEKPLETAELGWKSHLNMNCFHNGPDSSLSYTGAGDHAVAEQEILPLKAPSCLNFIALYLLVRALHNAFLGHLNSLLGVFDWLELDGSAASWTARSPWISKHIFFHILHRLCLYAEVISDKQFLCVWLNYKSSQKNKNPMAPFWGMGQNSLKEGAKTCSYISKIQLGWVLKKGQGLERLIYYLSCFLHLLLVFSDITN